MQIFKTYLISILKSMTVKIVLSRIFGIIAVSAGGFKIWLARIILEYGFDKLLVPVINFLIRKGALVYDVTEGKIKIKKLNEAREDGNTQDYNEAIDNVLNRRMPNAKDKKTTIM